MKKTALILAAVLLLSLPACSSAKNEESSKENDELSSSLPESSQKSDINTSASSADMPLEPEAWGRCAKFSVSEQGYSTVPVRLTGIERGSTAQKKAMDFLNAHSEYNGISRPAKGQEWVAVDYEIVLDGFPLDKSGTDAVITAFVQAEDGGDIMDGDNAFFPVTVNISDDSVFYEGTVKGSVVFVLPKSCTDFLMVFGEYEEEQAFIKCSA